MTDSADVKNEQHKVVVNDCYGGFELSKEAVAYLEKQPEVIELKKQDKDFDINKYFEYEGRTNPALVRCVELLGEKASGPHADLVIKMFKGEKYKISEYDGWETVETPDNTNWLAIKKNKIFPEKSNHENQDKEKLERLDLVKMSALENSVNSGKTRPDALQELYGFTQKDTTSVVLTVAVMHAQELSFYPKYKNKEVVNPVLVPYIAKVMNGALYNPNCDSNVIEASSHTIANISKNNLWKDDIKNVQEQIKELENLIDKLKKKIGQRDLNNYRNINLNTAQIGYATKYMGARGMDFVKDDEGHSILLPKTENNGDLPSRIKAELQRRSNLQSGTQKSGAPLSKSIERV